VIGLNQAMPQWRSFSSDAPNQPVAGARPGTPTEPPAGSRAVWLVALLAALGGAACGAATVSLLVLVLGAAPSDPFETAFGEPLDALTDAAGGGLSSEPGRPSSAEPVGLVVDVAGAVMRPGLHRLHAGDRVGDAIEAAGGFAPRVDVILASQALNLAQPLEDGTKVLVPELGRDGVGPVPSADARVDLNQAGQGELETLPGIGPVTARKIIAARSDARFASVRDLRGRGIVGQSLFDDLKDLVRVSS